MGRGKLSFFILRTRRRKSWRKWNFQLQNILNKTNKNDYILLSGDLNARIGNAEIYNVVGNFGEPVTNTSGLELRDFATYNNMKIMNSFYKEKIYVHTHIHTRMVSLQFQKSYRLFHCKQEAIRTIPRRESVCTISLRLRCILRNCRCESLQRKWYWLRSIFDFG